MSEFQYSGFVSYRNGRKDSTTKKLKDELKNNFAIQFHEALQDEVSVLTSKDVFIDMERIDGAYILKSKFSKDLRDSLCYIVIYTPDYFNIEKRFCTTEFIAIQEIVAKRYQTLDWNNPTKSFIIPIILRGENAIPTLLSDIAYFDLSHFDDTKRRIKKNKNFVPQIKQIAAYIDDLHKESFHHSKIMVEACQDIELLHTENDKDAIIDFLEKHQLALVPKRPW
jgi:hypothetical protein